MTQSKVEVLSNNGEMVDVDVLTVDTKQIANFVEMHRRDYFENHSLQYCLEVIVTRGMAEIKRYVKTNQVRKEQMASGALLKQMNLTPAQARLLLLEGLKAVRDMKSNGQEEEEQAAD